jgi:dihydrofolate reductase
MSKVKMQETLDIKLLNFELIMTSIIVAVANNNVIGKDNTLIWHLPADMRFFKEKTTGHCIITGRKNYESIPEKFRPLPNRTNIVITRQKDYEAPGAIVVSSIEEAFAKAKEIEDTEIFIIGGAEIYKQTLPLTDRIYLTKINHTFDGDAFFPELNPEEWLEAARIKGIVDEKNKYEYDFVILERSKN